jgi:hypothetical protein
MSLSTQQKQQADFKLRELIYILQRKSRTPEKINMVMRQIKDVKFFKENNITSDEEDLRVIA